jgi:hypothetical protein
MVGWMRGRLSPWDDVGETVSIEASIQQATQALDMASRHAARRGSSEELTNVSHGWMRMVETLAGLSAQAEARENDAPPAPTQMGFVGARDLDETSETHVAKDEEE